MGMMKVTALVSHSQCSNIGNTPQGNLSWVADAGLGVTAGVIMIRWRRTEAVCLQFYTFGLGTWVHELQMATCLQILHTMPPTSYPLPHTTNARERERYIHTPLTHQSIPIWSSLYSHGDDKSYSTPGDRCEVIFHTSSPGQWQAWDVPYSRQCHKYRTPRYRNIWGPLSRYLQTQPTHEGMWHITHTTRYKGLHDL